MRRRIFEVSKAEEKDILKTSELIGFLEEMCSVHGDHDVFVPGVGEDVPVEGVVAVLVQESGRQYYVIADAMTIDGTEADENLPIN